MTTEVAKPLEESFPARLRRLRSRAGYTQQRLAEEAQVSESYVSQLENGKYQNPSGQRVARIAAVLHVSVDELLGTGKGPLRFEEYPENLRSVFDEIQALWESDPDAAEALERIIRFHIAEMRRSKRYLEDQAANNPVNSAS